ncbi:lamin tail domain-containing protein [Candidatus Roizmanbacteria bacterium]|nr:MAG: lamin tail domain-containing protein [Candidatus Roizmanbacteria bacterium]
MVLILLLLIYPFSVFAAETNADIYINEFQIEPLQQVEIVNRGISPFDISGWYIDDDGGTSYYTVSQRTIIEPNSCVVIEGKFNLNKASGDTIRLFDSTAPPTATLSGLIDSYTYDTSRGEFISFQRIPDGSEGWLPEPSTLGNWNGTKTSCQILPSPTPTLISTPIPEQTPTPSPTDIPPVTNIRISETMVYPDSGANEWIELYNPNNHDVTLLNWYIDDTSDAGASPKRFTLLLPAKDYGVYELSSGIFNNSGDSVRLLNSSNIVIDSFSYLNAQKGLSVGRPEIMTEAVCRMEPTNGYENESCSETTHATPEPPAPEVTPILSQFITIPESNTSESTVSDYMIVVTMPETRPKNPDILGTDDYVNHSEDGQKLISLSSLSPLYSLLSIISLTVKMKLK